RLAVVGVRHVGRRLPVRGRPAGEGDPARLGRPPARLRRARALCEPPLQGGNRGGDDRVQARAHPRVADAVRRRDLLRRRGGRRPRLQLRRPRPHPRRRPEDPPGGELTGTKKTVFFVPAPGWGRLETWERRHSSWESWGAWSPG